MGTGFGIAQRGTNVAKQFHALGAEGLSADITLGDGGLAIVFGARIRIRFG